MVRGITRGIWQFLTVGGLTPARRRWGIAARVWAVVAFAAFGATYAGVPLLAGWRGTAVLLAAVVAEVYAGWRWVRRVRPRRWRLFLTTNGHVLCRGRYRRAGRDSRLFLAEIPADLHAALMGTNALEHWVPGAAGIIMTAADGEPIAVSRGWGITIDEIGPGHATAVVPRPA